MRDSMRIRRNLESLSLRLRSRCLRTATAWAEGLAWRVLVLGETAPLAQRGAYLLDEHVQVLRDIGGKACHTSLCQPGDQAEA